MESFTFSQPCRLLNLPDELKLQVVNLLDNRRDLYNLSLTCRILEDIVMNRLYHNVDFEMPQSTKPGTPFRDPVMYSVRNLTIRNGTMERKTSAYTRRNRPEAGFVEAFVSEMLDKIPEQQLTSFAFLHQNPLNRQILELLTERHETTLKHLRFFEISSWHEETTIPTNLTSFECRAINDGEGAAKIISANRATLRRLQLGQERQLVEQYHQSRISYMEQIPQPMDTFFTTVFALESLPKLRELSLHGLDVTMLRPASIPQALLFCNLERLTLESCPGSAELLESLAGTFHWASTSPDAPQNPRVTPALKHFLFRHEMPTNAIKDAAIRFLTSFTGLRTLSMLFENSAILERPSTLIAGHGPTLETLVFESRIQPREHLSLDTSRPFGVGGYNHELWEESINDIARLCPNLVELGMGFPWNDEIVRLRKTALPTLQQLRTIHIRNFPENHVFSQLGDYSIKEYATKFIEWVFPALVGGSRPALAHLAIGPTLYESRWKITPTVSASPGATGGASLQRRLQPPEFLRTHHFCLDWAKTRFGRWSPLTTPVSEKFMEEVAGEKPLKGVFEPVWLR